MRGHTWNDSITLLLDQALFNIAGEACVRKSSYAVSVTAI